MIKAVLCLIIICASGILGILKGQTYSQRVVELGELRDMFLELQTEISYMKDPLPVIFERLCAQQSGETIRGNLPENIMRNCCSMMAENVTMQAGWDAAVEKACESSCLTTEDKKIISGLGAQLGRSNVAGQVELLKMTDEKLTMRLRDAESLRNSKGKMYTGLGFSLGIVAAVIFI